MLAFDPVTQEVTEPLDIARLDTLWPEGKPTDPEFRYVGVAIAGCYDDVLIVNRILYAGDSYHSMDAVYKGGVLAGVMEYRSESPEQPAPGGDLHPPEPEWPGIFHQQIPHAVLILIKIPRPALRQTESGGAAFQKSLAEFAARRRQIKCNPFSPGACTWAKILLSLQVWNWFAHGEPIMRAADCKPFVQKGQSPFWTDSPARPCCKQSRAGDVFYSASCSGSSSVMVGMKARASLPRPRCLI